MVFTNVEKASISTNNKLLYIGYSAGSCVLTKNLDGFQLVDEPINPYNDENIIQEENEKCGISFDDVYLEETESNDSLNVSNQRNCNCKK